MTFEELEEVVKRHGQTLERHEFMLKSLTDLTGQVYKSLDEQYRLLSEISIKMQEGFSAVERCLASHDAQIKMLQNSIQMEAARSAQRDYDIEQRMNRRFSEVNLRFEALENRMDEHDKRFDEHDKRFDEHDKRFDRIDAELAELKQLIIERLPKA